MASRSFTTAVWVLAIVAVAGCRSRSNETDSQVAGDREIPEAKSAAKANPPSGPMEEVGTEADFDLLFANAEKWRYHDFYLDGGRTMLAGRVAGPLGGDGVMGWFVPVHVVIVGEPDATRRAVLGLCLNDDLEGASCEAKGKTLPPGTLVRVAGTPSGKTSWLAKYGGERQENGALNFTVWSYD